MQFLKKEISIKRLLASTATAFVVLFCLLVVASVFPISLFGGLRIYNVETGSMEPAIMTGSMIFVAPAEAYGVGDVITFLDPNRSKTPITHRIVGSRATVNGEVGFITRGDANSSADMNPVSQKNIIGKVVFSVPFFGYMLSAAKNRIIFLFLIIIPAAVIIYGELSSMLKDISKTKRNKSTTLAILLMFMASLSYTVVRGTSGIFSTITEISGNRISAAENRGTGCGSGPEEKKEDHNKDRDGKYNDEEGKNKGDEYENKNSDEDSGVRDKDGKHDMKKDEEEDEKENSYEAEEKITGAEELILDAKNIAIEDKIEEEITLPEEPVLEELVLEEEGAVVPHLENIEAPPEPEPEPEPAVPEPVAEPIEPEPVAPEPEAMEGDAAAE